MHASSRNPSSFDPERWSAEREQPAPKFAYFPFGGGPRICIGNNFALMEAAILLAAVAQRFQISLVPGQTIEPLASITLRPKHGVRVRLRRR